MKYVTFGRSGLEVSSVCLGTMTFGGAWSSDDDSREMYKISREAGVNFFDCANGYTNGRSEELMGECIQGHRHELVLTTKVGSKLSDAPNQKGCSRRHIIESLETSLRRLKTDYIDIFFLHRPDPQTPIEESLRTLDDLVRAGKIRYAACSNFKAWEIAHAMDISDRKGWIGYHGIQPRYNLLDRGPEEEMLPMARHYNLAVMAYSPLAGGLFSGKYGKNAQFTEEKSRLKDFKVYQKRWGNEDQIAIAEQFNAIAQEVGVHPATLAVAWVEKHPDITTPIIGARRAEQLKPSLAASDYVMSDELYTRIRRLVEPQDTN